jgi:cytochrome c-type biogenesis protein CcmE
MPPQRRKRLIAVVFLLVGASATAGVVLNALQDSIDVFYPPDKIVSGKVPLGARVRAGGMVLEGSVQRAPDNLDVSFVLTDRQGSEFTVRYTGILPDLFREGQGILATGRLGADGVFVAEEVLAKHDENYMPPELSTMKSGAS